MAQRIRRETTNLKIAGSNPGHGNVYQMRVIVAQLGERQTEDLKVPGSIPGDGIVLFCC